MGARTALQAFWRNSTVLASKVNFAKTEARAAKVPARMAVGMAADDPPWAANAAFCLLTAAVVFLGLCPDMLCLWV